MRITYVGVLRVGRLGLLASIVSLGGCNPDKCPGDQWEYDSTYAGCKMVMPDQGDGDSGDGDTSAGDGDGAVPDAGMAMDDVPFGAECMDDSDCGPGLCVNEPIMLGCTQRSCMEGQANAGVCPADWMCFPDPESGDSACVKF